MVEGWQRGTEGGQRKAGGRLDSVLGRTEVFMKTKDQGPKEEEQKKEARKAKKRKVLLDLLDVTRQQNKQRAPEALYLAGIVGPHSQGPVRRDSELAARCRRQGSEQGAPLAACSQPGASFPCGDLQSNLTEGSRAHHDSVLNSHIRGQACHSSAAASAPMISGEKPDCNSGGGGGSGKSPRGGGLVLVLGCVYTMLM